MNNMVFNFTNIKFGTEYSKMFFLKENFLEHNFVPFVFLILREKFCRISIYIIIPQTDLR